MKNEEFEDRLRLNIIELRKKSGYSAYAVAKLLGKTTDAYYAYEAGRRSIPVSVIYELSKIFNVSVDDIINNEITYNRKKTISYDLISENQVKKILINAQNDDVVFFEKNQFELDYFVKCNDLVLNRKALIKIKDEFIEGIISHDEVSSVYAVLNLKDNSTTFFSPKKFQKYVLTLGDYAGSINKQLIVPDFL